MMTSDIRPHRARTHHARRADMINVDVEEMLRAVGSELRRTRQSQQLSLDIVATRSGLTAAMVSMVELGRVAPSFGTLIAIASALDIRMADLFDIGERSVREAVCREEDQPLLETSEGAMRRIVQADQARGLELLIDHYEPGTANAPTPVRHAGVEYALLVEGALTIELDGIAYELQPGDSISYSSSTPHRISNDGPVPARAVWVKLDTDHLERARRREDRRGRRWG
jgi:transcriptional regulator with XRE-family HTH domain